MTTPEIITIAAIILGPIFAVLITLWIDQRRKNRDQRLTIFRILMSTRDLPSDPAFSAAVKLIPVEFSKSRDVISAHKQFLTASQTQPNNSNHNQVLELTRTRANRLIFEIAKELGFPLAESDIQLESYTAQGWIEREAISLDAQKASRDLVNVLLLQSRIMANVPLSVMELRLLNAHQEQES